MGNRKIGNLCAIDVESGADYGGIIWASIWSSTYDNKTLVTIFFTRNNNPRYNSWLKSLCDITDISNWNITQKGTYQHGFYFKVSITTTLNNAQNLLDCFLKWKYDSDEGIKYSIELTKDIDTLYTELLAKAI